MRRSSAAPAPFRDLDGVDCRSLGQHLDSRLARILQSVGQHDRVPNALRVAHRLAVSWRNEIASRGPTWASDITDDHTPFEFSLALNGRSESVRILTEPQDTKNPSLAASWRLATELHEDLASSWGAGFESYSRVSDLFQPTPGDDACFSVWHSAVFEERGPQFKVYLNPAIHGAGNAGRVLGDALQRLGLSHPWEAIARTALGRGGLDQPMYFSLDLIDAPDARVKIYVAHRDCSAQQLLDVLAPCPGFDPSSTSGWVQQLMGNSGPFLERPPITCFALRGGSPDLLSVTLHLPVRCYLADDFEIARRVCRLVKFPQQVSFMRALTVAAERPLESDRGLQTYVSLRPTPGREAVTVYLAPQVYSTSVVRGVDAGWSFKETG